jgi:peptide/nickel transport system ATP-binding protein/oligopeptide transport system ATP-binding protein
MDRNDESMTDLLLDIRNLTVTFATDDGVIRAVDDLSFSIGRGETVALVGESGAGKSVSAMSVPRLVPSPPATVEKGEILFKGRDLLKLDIRDMKSVRGNEIGVIFQDPTTALSPLHTIGWQLAEAVKCHRDVDDNDAKNIAESWLQRVRIPDARQRLGAYPFQLSGGMQQRVMIAMALLNEPDLIIADEPTTALDVTLQAQVFDIIREMKRNESAMLLITHDLGVVYDICDRILVMYASELVEEGKTDDLFARPAHPYTLGLLKSIPTLGKGKSERLESIKGQVPSPLNYPSGCRFHDRCPMAFGRCKEEKPGFYDVSEGHRAACFLLEETGKGEKT